MIFFTYLHRPSLLYLSSPQVYYSTPYLLAAICTVITRNVIRAVHWSKLHVPSRRPDQLTSTFVFKRSLQQNSIDDWERMEKERPSKCDRGNAGRSTRGLRSHHHHHRSSRHQQQRRRRLTLRVIIIKIGIYQFCNHRRYSTICT